MTLKLKSLFYRYTGVYLADKEEAEYIRSGEAQQYIHTLASHPENELTIEEATDLTIGMWQADEGFHRPMSFLRYKNPRFIFRILGWFEELYKTIKWDLQRYFGND